MNTKAQLAMETIMIYGAAILVVTLAIGALIYFGVLDLGGLLPDKCNTGNAVVCEDYRITPSGIRMDFRNRVGKSIIISSLTIAGSEDWSAVTCNTNIPIPQTKNGELSNMISCAPNGITETDVGKKLKGRVTVTYTAGTSSIPQTAIGELNAKIAASACIGTPNACSTYSAQTACTAAAGCSWLTTTCTGTPNACSTYTQTACTAAAGCSWS